MFFSTACAFALVNNNMAWKTEKQIERKNVRHKNCTDLRVDDTITKTEKGKDNLYRFYLHADKGENLAAVESCFLENYGSLSIKKLKT